MSVLRPGIRTFKPRRSRITAREQSALDSQSALAPVDALLLQPSEPLDFPTLWGPGTPVVLEIGFGSGSATCAMAVADPSTGVLAVDVHTPGVGDLLDHLTRAGVRNVRVIEADALDVLKRIIPAASLVGVRSFFPDPWPKTRHHKRRLVQPAVIDLVGTRLRPGGTWHLATDWPDYAQQAIEVFDGMPGWSGGPIPRPGWRPVTPFERRAVRDGRPVTDLMFTFDPASIAVGTADPSARA